MDTNLHEAFIQLVRLGIGKSKDAKTLENDINWSELKTLAEIHGLYAVVLDGIGKLPQTLRPSQVLLLEWIGEVLQEYEYRYEQYENTISELSSFYNAHGFKMMVVKGYACSLDWPKPSHRPCGDIDMWLFGRQIEADIVLAKEKRIEIDKSHHHHTVFNWNGFTVENHYDFINVYHHKSHSKLEKLFKELGQDDSHFVELKNVSAGSETMVYLPSPNLHALFLLKHTMLHFVSGEINLRQLVDWGFFVEKHTNEIDWKWLEGELDEFGMMPLYQLFNAICVDDLGFSPQLFPSVQFNPGLKDKVLAEVLMPDQVHNGNKGLIIRLVSTFRRWKDSAWKHELCYKESMWSAFWYGILGHLLKPSSI